MGNSNIAPFFLLIAPIAAIGIFIAGYLVLRRLGQAGRTLGKLAIVLLLPLAGLLLNIKIPFPANLQTPAIYILTVANGILLSLPRPATREMRRMLWFAQCALFPFTTCFFVLFLPAIPLIPLAMIFFGLGLLILVPSLLFALHIFRIVDGLHEEMRVGSRLLAPLLAMGAIALGPALLTIQALRDRAALASALDYLNQPDYSRPATFPGDLGALESALSHLADGQTKSYLPIYSDFYRRVAFGNRLLANHEMEEMWADFFDARMPRASRRSSDSLVVAQWQDPQLDWSILAPARPQPGGVVKSLETTFRLDADLVRATARIDIANPSGEQREYRATILVPPEVWITNMRLGSGTRPPSSARLLAENPSPWIVADASRARKEPQVLSTLRYVSPGEAELRIVLPRASVESRVEIDFTYPDNLSPSVVIDRHPLALPPAARHVAVASGAASWVPPGASASVIPLQRIPQPWLLVDTSSRSIFRDNPAALRNAIAKALDAFPSARTARVMFVNFNTRDFRAGAAIPLAELRTIDPADLLRAAGRFQGGYRESFAIKSALVRHHQTGSLEEYPAAISLRGDKPLVGEERQLAEFARLLPDRPMWWMLYPKSTSPMMRALNHYPSGNDKPEVHAFRIGGNLLVAEAQGTAAFIDWSQHPAGSLAIYDPAVKTFAPLAAATDTALAAGANAWALALRHVFHPTDGDTFASAAREAGVLVPSTVYVSGDAADSLDDSLATYAIPARSQFPGTLGLYVLTAITGFTFLVLCACRWPYSADRASS